MKPFPEGEGLKIMLQSASAGVMEGDSQEFSFDIGAGTRLVFMSQAFEKIHKMNNGYASRGVHVRVGSGASFFYTPLPAIPFAGSAFKGRIEVELEDETSEFILADILSCGRSARGERFGYRFYHSLTEIKRAGKWIYRDNARYEPDAMDMEGMGMYESHTHLANVFITKGNGRNEAWAEAARQRLKDSPELQGGITQLAKGDYAVRILGGSAETLMDAIDDIMPAPRWRPLPL
jgi:urease accessory protein